MWGLTPLALAGLVTVVISSIGAIVCMHHFKFFRGSTTVIAKRLRLVFLTDALIYISTISFGVFSYLGFTGEDFTILYVIRMIVFVVNILAAFKLYQTYRKIENGSGT